MQGHRSYTLLRQPAPSPHRALCSRRASVHAAWRVLGAVRRDCWRPPLRGMRAPAVARPDIQGRGSVPGGSGRALAGGGAAAAALRHGQDHLVVPCAHAVSRSELRNRVSAAGVYGMYASTVMNAAGRVRTSRGLQALAAVPHNAAARAAAVRLRRVARDILGAARLPVVGVDILLRPQPSRW